MSDKTQTTDLRIARDAEVARLRRVLAYYAAPGHYDGGDVPGHIYVLDDGGRYAREALGLPQRFTDRERFTVELQCREMMRDDR